MSVVHWGNNYKVIKKYPRSKSDSYNWTGTPGSLDSKESACIVGNPGWIPGSGRAPRDGNGNPLQYSCLENPIDGGSWQATVQGVTRNHTQLSDFTFNFVINLYWEYSKGGRFGHYLCYRLQRLGTFWIFSLAIFQPKRLKEVWAGYLEPVGCIQWHTILSWSWYENRGLHFSTSRLHLDIEKLGWAPCLLSVQFWTPATNLLRLVFAWLSAKGLLTALPQCHLRYCTFCPARE